MSRTRSQWTNPPKPGDEVTCIFGVGALNARPIKSHVNTVTARMIFVRGLHDEESMLFWAREEGVKWARGWDPETARALSAAYALAAP